jgi:hypothetical protein
LFPQVPQLFGSVTVLVHEPAHAVVPLGQVATHVPLLQLGVLPEQTLPQVPQFFGSVLLFTHEPLQRMVPLGHVLQVPA